MTGWYIFGAVLLLIAAVMLIKVKFIISLGETLSMRLRILFFSVRILPSDASMLDDDNISPGKKRKILKKLSRKREKKAAKAAKKQKHKKKGAAGTEQKGKKEKVPKKRKLKIVALIRFAARAAGIVLAKFGKHLYIHVKRLKITVASDDAARTAYIFGGVSQAVAYLFSVLEKAVKFKADSKNICVNADFLADKMSQDVEIVISMRPGGLFLIAFTAIRQALHFFFHRNEFFKPVKKKDKNEKADKNDKAGKDGKNDKAGKDGQNSKAGKGIKTKKSNQNVKTDKAVEKSKVVKD